MNKKRGMSIAAVLGIMVCLVSIVTTVFVLAIRSSVLTSKSLRYIETYNEASTSIDNSVDFMVNEANKITGSIDGNFVNEKCDAMEMLFGVICTPSVEPGTTAIDMSIGFMVEIKKEFYNMGSDFSYLRSVVEFSASMTGGAPQIITPDLAIDKTVEIINKDQLLANKYNPRNLLWNYWADQYDSSEDGDTTKNTLIKILRDGGASNFQGPAAQLIGNFTKLYPYLSDYDIIDNVQYITIDGVKYQLIDALRKLGLDNLIGNIHNYSTYDYIDGCNNAFLGYGGYKNVFNGFSDQEWNQSLNKHVKMIEKKYGIDTDSDGIVDTIIFNEPVRILDFYPSSNIRNILITNNSLVYVNNGARFNCNFYVERGSTFFCGGSVMVDEYTTKSGANAAPIVDADFVSSSSMENSDYIGGGILTKGDFIYQADDALSKDTRYNYRTKSYIQNNAYINGGFTIGNKCKMVYYKEDSESATKISTGATIYCSNELTIANLAFAGSSSGIRPFLGFCESSVNIKYCSSMINGSIVEYRDGFDPIKNSKNVGFGIITCTKMKTIKGGKYLTMLNVFYNNTSEMDNDKSANLLDASKDWQDEVGTNYGFNCFVSDTILQNCTNNIERDSLHWYIPDKLRGSFIQAAISSTQSNASRG